MRAKHDHRGKLPFVVALVSVSVALIVAASVSVAVLSYSNMRASVERLSGSLFQEMFRNVYNVTKGHFGRADPILELSRRLVADGWIEPTDYVGLGQHFVRVLQTHPQLTEAGYGDRHGVAVWAEREPGRIVVYHYAAQADGSSRERRYEVTRAGTWELFLERDDHTYDPRQRPWYQSAAAQDGPAWTEPYIWSSGVPGISRARRLLDSAGELQGVLDVSFELGFLSSSLRGLNEDVQGELAIWSADLAGDGTRDARIIAHPDPGRTVAHGSGGSSVMTLAALGDARLQAAFDALLATASDDALVRTHEARFQYEGDEHILLAQPLFHEQGLRWYTALLLSEDALLSDVQKSTRETTLMCVLLVLVSGLLALGFSRRIGASFRTLYTSLGNIERFDLRETELAPSFIREIDELYVSVDKMRVGLRSFEKFVPSELVRALIEQGVEARLGGRRQAVTVFFSDVVGFTTLAERMSGERLVLELGAYLAEMTGEIEAHGGTVNQYVGDCIMAIWGAPRAVEQPELQACRAALRCQQRLAELAPVWRQAGRPVFECRIGIHTGEPIVGNMGSPGRLYFTANGDAVNLASRLEGLNKRYGTRILVSASTYAGAGGGVVGRLLDHVVVRGRTQGIWIYELLAERGCETAAQTSYAGRYTAALRAHRARDWDAAIDGFERCLVSRDEDRAARLLLERSRTYRDAPPGEAWDGAATFPE